MDKFNRDEAKLLRYTYANFSKEDVDKVVDKIFDIVDKERKEKDDQIEDLFLIISEYKRLHSELNTILHPNGDRPENPSLCDLVAFVQKDLKDLRSRAECTIKNTSSTCNWKQDSNDEYNVYNTKCGNALYFSNDGNPSENEYKFCPYCSGEIKVISSFSLRESLN